MTALIATQQLCKTYLMGEQTVHALVDVSLTIEQGEFVAIMGASGSGKSTLMNLLGCLDQPTSGSYTLNGSVVSTLESDALATVRNQLIGFVFQSFNLLPRTSARDNVALPLLYANTRWTPAQRHQKAAARLQQVGLAARMDHQPQALSGGQQQRVAIARALVNDPKLILADEPTGALDSRTSIEIMVLLQTLNQAGMTVVMVTHEPDVAAFADRVITFKDGRVVQDKSQLAQDASIMLSKLGAPA